jgi:hypothetical protein
MAQLSFDIDMQPGTPAIENWVSASVGVALTADIWITIPAGSTGLSSYGFSVQFDNSELNLNGAPATTEHDPDGLGSWVNGPGVGGEANNIGGGLGQVSWIDGVDGTAFPPWNPLLPVTRFKAATVNFTTVGVSNDGLADVTPGLFAAGWDGLFDKNFNAINNVTWNPGYVIPEPGATKVFLAVATLLAGLGIRWIKR